MTRQMMAALLALTAMMSTSAPAAEYPERPIRLIIPFPAGSSTDALGREVAQFMGASLEQTIVADNRPGALATLGTGEAARAKPDGYTLLLGTSTTHAAAPSLFKSLPYDPVKDFVPIGRVAAVVFALAVRPGLPVNSVQELIDYGRQPGHKPLTWGYANSANQVAGASLVQYGGFESTPVPYKGVPQIMVDMLGGNIDFTIADLASIVPQAKAQKLRILAVTSPEEVAQLPGVPPLGQTLKGFSLLGWYGLYAPRGTPKAITDKLAGKLLQGLKDPALAQRIENAGLIPFPASGDALAAYTTAEIEKWRGLVKAAHIDPQ